MILSMKFIKQLLMKFNYAYVCVCRNVGKMLVWCCIFPCVKLRIPRLVSSLFGITRILNSFGRTLTLLYCKNSSLRRNGKKNEKLLIYICFVLFGNEEIKCLLIIYHINSLNPFLCVIFLEWAIRNKIKILFLRIYQ